jgi:bifunctional non-homologous end joining protein LigD
MRGPDVRASGFQIPASPDHRIPDPGPQIPDPGDWNLQVVIENTLMPPWRENPANVRPMLATLAHPPLTGKGLIFEPKYDGIRALVHIAPGKPRPDVRLWSRLGNDKTAQFPAVVRAVEPLARSLEAPLLIDGEIVALDSEGRPGGFQQLQGRIHVKGSHDIEALDRAQPTAFIAFDLLRDGAEDVRGLPLTERRARLNRHLERFRSHTLRSSEQVAQDGRALERRARDEGWEGLIVKEGASPYHAGRRSPAWRKLKLVNEEEFVVAGWTEPRNTRSRFGALLLGAYDDQQPGRPLVYIGHTGTGFDQKELDRVFTLLATRETPQSPFRERIKTNEPAHWVRPELVAQVRFTEWTADRKLRHPVYLGLRDDKRANEVTAPHGKVASRAAHEPAQSPRAARTARKDDGRRDSKSPAAKPPKAIASVVEQLRALEDARKDGAIELPSGERLSVTNLAKVFWPKLKLTKGDLLRYYAQVSHLILPVVSDRPLVMKRFPNGIDKPAFYQQRSRIEQPPPGVRIEILPPEGEPISEPNARRFVGGNLITLLYMTQIAAISQDPWFSRVRSPLDADYTALDLDPGDDTPFSKVVDVARWIRDELQSLRVPGVLKTSGSRGLHVYIPLAPGTSYESGMLFCQIIATLTAARHPKTATVERMVRARPRGTVYVDYLQNILGKTLATAYSARATEFAGVSTPLGWEELDEPLDPRDFTISTVVPRFTSGPDLWARLRTARPAVLETVFKKYAKEWNGRSRPSSRKA